MSVFDFTIPAMSCVHCVGMITRAVQAVDLKTLVQVDLAGRRVQVETSRSRAALAATRAETGYAPT